MKIFQDCPYCPELVVVPAGHGWLGSDRENPKYGPATKIKISPPFAIGRAEVTAGEFRKCQASGGCAKDAGRRFDPYAKRFYDDVPDSSPRDMISWDDARDYVAWLSAETGHRYRLPSEAEWEYAARAGSKTRFWWGDKMRPGMANCEACGDHDTLPTTPAGTYPANPFGLYDVHGNISEWTQDCWNDSHVGRSGTGAPRLDGRCEVRIFKGGTAQDSKVKYIVGAHRHAFLTDIRRNHLGLRVVRELDSDE